MKLFVSIQCKAFVWQCTNAVSCILCASLFLYRQRRVQGERTDLGNV